jgi:hypothetical protein
MNASRARRFWIHIDAFDAPYGRVWAVQTRRQYLTATRVECHVPTHTVFRGRAGRQPRAYLRGIGVVVQHGATITIREAD